MVLLFRAITRSNTGHASIKVTGTQCPNSLVSLASISNFRALKHKAKSATNFFKVGMYGM